MASCNAFQRYTESLSYVTTSPIDAGARDEDKVGR
jgi:hypothetical protein